ncbi:hypothetical protein MNB_SV-6-685 [hydrothermal vent metagenome]|uniref:Uncharacterized protein n=1 Tax=hydrothermal vent metagenome TaxID=652676 RepID=A0A1W1BU96_9ZZZZ
MCQNCDEVVINLYFIERYVKNLETMKPKSDTKLSIFCRSRV